MRTKSFLLFCLFSLFCACANRQQNDPPAEEQRNNILRGKVVAVSDGDTFRLLTDNNETVRVRLHGVDAPEKKQDYGTEARQRLSELVFSKQVEVDKRNKDRYGRIIGVAFVAGINVNEELLRKGMVWHYKEYDKTDRWSELEREAKRKRLGLWRQPNPTPPWQWRKQQREEKEVAD